MILQRILFSALTILVVHLPAVLATATEPDDKSVAVVSVDARRVLAPNDRFWANAVLHPTEYLDSDWGKEHFKLVCDGGVTRKFARIYNQPEDASYIKDDGTVGYRWDHFDRRADMIVGRGLKLLVAFYSMPPHIAADKNIIRRRPFLNGKKIFIGPPKDYRLWQEACADFTRHVIDRYGEDRVAQWRFTCWNEPDLSGFWKSTDLVEYRKIYDHFATGVKSACPRIQVGGAALSSGNTFRHPQNFRGFLQHVTSGKNYATGKTGSPIDYIAVHTYGGGGGGGGGGGSKFCPYPSIDYIMEQQKRLVKMRDEFPELSDVPIVIQEWGVSSGGTRGMDRQPLAEVRNTNYAAAFLAAMVARQIDWRRNDDPRLSDMFICLSGNEIKRHRDFEGKRTVQTISGFDKPLLNGYRALDRLGDQLIAGQVEGKENKKHLLAISTCDKDGRVAILVTHFRNDWPKDKAPAQKVDLQVDTHWPDGTRVELRHWRIDNSHSNAYSVYCRLGSPTKPTVEQIRQIKDRMGLELLESPKVIEKQKRIRLQFDLSCNAVSLIELVKQK